MTIESPVRADAESLSPACLSRLVGTVTAAGEWRGLVEFCAARRWYRRLTVTADYEIWLLSWLPGQQTGFHDHGDASGAYAVVLGELRETLGRPASRQVRRRMTGPGTVISFGPRHVHDVAHAGHVPAVSVHAYSPPLTAMRRYEMAQSGLTLARTDLAEVDW